MARTIASGRIGCKVRYALVEEVVGIFADDHAELLANAKQLLPKQLKPLGASMCYYAQPVKVVLLNSYSYLLKTDMVVHSCDRCRRRIGTK